MGYAMPPTLTTREAGMTAQTPIIPQQSGSGGGGGALLAVERLSVDFTLRTHILHAVRDVSFTLHKGRNVICGSVINGPGMSDFCARFIDENGNPVKDLTINLESAGT